MFVKLDLCSTQQELTSVPQTLGMQSGRKGYHESTREDEGSTSGNANSQRPGMDALMCHQKSGPSTLHSLTAGYKN